MSEAGETFLCPFSGESLCHPCPVVRCPANLADASKENSCAYALHEATPEYIADATGLDEDRLRDATARQVDALGAVMRTLRELREAEPPPHACPHCGYPSGCATAAVCEDRQDALKTAAVNVVGGSAPLLRRFQLWRAVIEGRADFLTQWQRALLGELISRKDAAQHEHPRNTAGEEAV